MFFLGIHWPGSRDGPPLDVPECGFLGNAPECQDNGISAQFIINSHLPAIMNLILLYFYYAYF